MKKYYIEICELGERCGYILQSRFFDTEEQAIKWAKNITFLDYSYYDINLMCAEWDTEDDTYEDIQYVRNIQKELA